MPRPLSPLAILVGIMISGPPTSPMFCRQCGYNLHGLSESRCSECGRTFDPNDRKTYSSRPGSPLRRRWIKRFAVSLVSLTLLAGTGVFSLWWPWHRNAAAIRMVKQFGGTIQTKTVGPQFLQDLLGRRLGFLLERAGPKCDFCESRLVTDADLSVLDRLSDVRELYLNSTHVTDAGLAHVMNIQGLQELYLNGTEVTDTGLAQLTYLKDLRLLSLQDTKVTDEGLRNLRNLKGLQTLDLSDTKVTDAGVEHLKELKGLQTLGLSGTKLTDVGLDHLKDMDGLQCLYLLGTQATTYEGRAALKIALPECNIIDFIGR